MADQVQWRGGSRENSDDFTGAPREVTVDTTDWILRVHDGIKPGGHKMMKVNDCLVVQTADKCNPEHPSCKVTVNGQLDVNGDVDLDGNMDMEGDLNLDGNLTVLDKHDTLLTGDLNVEGKTNVEDLHVTGCISNPSDPCGVNEPVVICDDLHVKGDVLIDGSIDLGEIVIDLYTDDVTLKNPGDYVFDCNVPDANGLKTQFDVNAAFYNGIRILDEKLCIAQKEINGLEYQYQQLEKRVDQNEIDIAELKVEIANLKQEIADIESAIKLLELEIENNANAILDHEGRISALEVKIDQINTEINDLKDDLANLKLNDLVDCGVPNPKNGQQLVFRNGQWVAEDNAFTDQAVHFMGFVNVEDDSAPTGGAVKPGDTYIQHKVDESEATANNTWTGIQGEQVAEGQYVMYGADSKWHKGKTVESVDQIQADWDETDVSAPAFIKNKPDIQADIDASIGNGSLRIQDANGVELGTFEANQSNNEVVTLPATFSGDYNDLNNKPTPPVVNDGTLNIKDFDGTSLGTFTANQATTTDVILPKGFSGSYDDLTDVPTKFPPEDHTHSYNDLTDKPTIPTVNNGKLTVSDSDGNKLGEFTANQNGNTQVTVPAASAGGAAGPQFTRKDNSWKIETTTKGYQQHIATPSLLWHDCILIDKAKGHYILVQSDQQSDWHNHSSLLTFPAGGGDKDCHQIFEDCMGNGGDFTDCIALQHECSRRVELCNVREVPGSFWFEQADQKLYWFEFVTQGDFTNLKLFSLQYDGDYFTNVPVLEKTGNYGFVEQTSSEGSKLNIVERLLWKFDPLAANKNVTFYKNTGTGYSQEYRQYKLENAKGVVAMWWMTNEPGNRNAYGLNLLVEDNTDWYRLDWSGGWNDGPTTRRLWRKDDRPIDSFSVRFGTGVFAFDWFSIVVMENVVYKTNKQPSHNAWEDIPEIAAIKVKGGKWGDEQMALIYQTGKAEDLVLVHCRDTGEWKELAGVSDPVVTPKSANPFEAVAWLHHPGKIHDDSMQDYGVALQLDSSIKDGMIVLDKNLPHGERFYFAEAGVAIASDCHMI